MKIQNNQQGVITDASQNNQQGVITDASQNNQQGVITGQNEINKFLSVQEPVGESVVRFKENFAVPVSPSNPYYPLFFHPELSEFKENIANEVSRLEKLNNLQSSKPALIEMELELGKKEIIKQAKEKHENLIQEANDVCDAAAAKIIKKNRPNVFETLQPTAAAIIALYNNKSKKGAEAFQRHLEIDKSELLAAKDTGATTGEVNLEFKEPKIKEFLTLEKYKGTWKEKMKNISWTEQISGTDRHLYSIAYGNGLWVAVGYKGIIMTSSDGISWTRRSINTTDYFKSVAYGNGLWVAVGRNGAIMTSKNGISWTKTTKILYNISSSKVGSSSKKGVPKYSVDSLESVAYGNGLWVAVGRNGAIMTSKNGVSWVLQRHDVDRTFYSVSYGNGIWVAVSDKYIFVSSSGISWSHRGKNGKYYSSSYFLYSVSYGNGLWVAVGKNGYIVTSNDAITWTHRKTIPGNLWNVSYNNGMWVAVGDRYVVTNSDPRYWSDDGRSWGYQDFRFLRATSYGNGMWVTVGSYGVIMTSAGNGASNIKDFIKQLHSLEQKHLITTEKEADNKAFKKADNKALKEAEENRDNAIESAKQKFEIKKTEIVQEILKDIKFMSQTTAVVLDERIRGWYRSYQQITDEERRFTGLKDACKYKLDANYEDRFSAVVDMDPTDFATTYNADLEDESIDLESSGYLKEIFQKSTTNEEGKVSQIPKSFSEIENDYARYRDLLYQIRDNKSELLREIRLAGYDLVELKEDVGLGGEDRDKVYGLGYHFAIIKGDPEYNDIDLPKGENILQGIYDEKDLLSDILAKDKLSKEIGEDTLTDIKKIFTNGQDDFNWQEIIKNFKNELETVGIPQELDHKFDIQQKQLVGPDDGTIPLSLTTEKEEEKYLKEAKLQIPSENVLKAKIDAEEKLIKQFEKLKKDFATHLATVDSITNLSDWKGADLFYRNFKTFYRKLENIDNLLKFEFYEGQGINIKNGRAVSNGRTGLIDDVIDTAANIYDPTGLVRNITSSVSNWFRQTLNDTQNPISSVKEVLGNLSILPIFGLQGSLGGSIALPLPIQGKLINNESPSNLNAQGSLNAINIPVSEMGFSAGTMTATAPSLPKNIGIVAVAFIGKAVKNFGNAVGSAIGFGGNVVSGLLGGGGGRGSRRQYIRKNITTNKTLSEPFWYIRIAGNVPDEVRDAWEARGFGHDFISSIKKGNTFVVKLGGWFGKDDSRVESSTSASRAKAVFYNFLNGCSALCDEMVQWHQEKIEAIKNEKEGFNDKKASYETSLKYLKDYALTKARLKFLLHWKSPGRFGGYKKISNAILPDTDPWVEFANQLKPTQKYNPLSRKVKIDHFRFFKNAYYTQDGLNMHAYLKLIAGDNRSKAMRVVIFPVLDSKGDEIPYLRRAVINPERSFESNPIKTLPKVRFIEQNKISVIWDGICLGELSHTENLMPGENKTITIEKQTRFKEKLATSFENEMISEVKDTVSFEEKLSQEVNNEETTEQETVRELEEKQEKSNTQKETILDEHQDTRTDTSSTSGEIGGSYKAISGNVKHSKDITKTSNQLNRNTQENENAVKDSKRLTQKEMSKEGRKTQEKNLKETIKKTATETSNTNKTSIKKTSEQESESMDKRLETIEISNQNVGKTLNYYFFQLQNIYQTITETENVKIVVDPGHEIIAKSKMSDVRVFDINNIASIYEELNCAGNKKQTLLATIILFYVFENYYNSSNVDSEGGRQGLTIDYRGELFNQNDKTIDELVRTKKLQSEVQAFFEKLKESSVNFNPIITDSQSDIGVNSGGLYLDVEVGKKMATEPYLENRRDIETHLQNTKVKQLEAEVKHLEAQTQAGIFFPPPQSTPIKTVPVNVNVGDSAGEKENSGSPFSSFPQDTSSSTTEEKTASEPADNAEKNK